jgi:hypothetical protein
LAGTVVTTLTTRGNNHKYSSTWVSSAGGVVSGNAITVTAGRISEVVVVPDGGGTQPTDLYDLTLVTADSIDVLGGTGADLSNAAGKIFSFDPPIYLPPGSTLDITIANAGNAKGGRIDIQVEGLRQ